MCLNLCVLVEDDRHRQVVEQRRRQRKQQLRAERRLARERRLQENLDRRGKRHRGLQEQQQYLEAGRPQFQNTQPERQPPKDRQPPRDRPMTQEERQQRRQQRILERNRKHPNNRTRLHKKRVPVGANLRSNELGENKRRNGTR
jgi:hypothetical protein